MSETGGNTFTVRGTGVNTGTAAGRLRFSGRRRPSCGTGYLGRDAELELFRAALVRAREAEAKKDTAEAETGKVTSGAEAGKDTAGTAVSGDTPAGLPLRDPQSTGTAEAGLPLRDPRFIGAVEAGIAAGLSAVRALDAAGKSAEASGETGSGSIIAAAARVADILCGGADGADGTEGGILVSPDLSPGQAAGLDTSRVLGIVTFGGSEYSHTAILARATGIPAIVRAGTVPDGYDGYPAIIDASAGTLTVNPTPDRLLEFEVRQKRDAEIASRLAALRELPAVTRGGRGINLYANIFTAAGTAAALKNGAGGIGLFRSEFLFLGRATPPGEEEQYAAYRAAVEAMGGRPVTVRTLDAGTDKVLPYLPAAREENPALGMRGIRQSLCQPALFRVQLRALCRASAHGPLSVMLPMVVSADEVMRTRELLAGVRNELRYREIAFDPGMPLGIMLETPAAAVMARELAEVSDFFSVGTNDLCRFTFAADRQNAEYACSGPPSGALEPVFRLIRHAADCIHAAGGGRRIDVCGELAADVTLTSRFLGCGVDGLSVSPPFIPALKERIRACE